MSESRIVGRLARHGVATYHPLARYANVGAALQKYILEREYDEETKYGKEMKIAANESGGQKKKKLYIYKKTIKAKEK